MVYENVLRFISACHSVGLPSLAYETFVNDETRGYTGEGILV